ncbi:MAG: RNA polymerase sigma factor [Acidimicrobiia bacterium]
MWSVSDDALLAGLASGDTDAASAFVERFQRRVFGLAITMVGDTRAATEVAERAFAEAARLAGSQDPRATSVALWLLGLTRRIALDHIHPGSHRDPDTLVDLEWGANYDPNEPLSDLRRFQVTLGVMAPETRRALLLAAFEGCTVREIAELETISPGTVTSRLRSALLTLHRAMVSEEP